MPSCFADVARWQSGAKGFFDELKSRYNCKGCMVQLCYGQWSRYDNPNASYQIFNAYKTFGNVSAYLYYMGYPTAEINHFLDRMHTFGLDKTTLVGLDIEDASLSGNLTHQVNIMLDKLYNAGYHNLAVYANTTFLTGRLNVSDFHHKPLIWCASYGLKPNIRMDAWQYTETGSTSYGSVDLSLDYSGKFTRSLPDDKPQYWSDGKLFFTKTGVNVYKDKGFKSKTQVRWGQNSQFNAKPVKIGKATYCLQTPDGYVTANKKWTQKIK